MVHVSNATDAGLEDLPPSAKLVYVVLAEEGVLTQKQLAAESRLSPRTVRYALGELRDVDVLFEDVNFADARKRLYRLDAPETEE